MRVKNGLGVRIGQGLASFLPQTVCRAFANRLSEENPQLLLEALGPRLNRAPSLDIMAFDLPVNGPLQLWIIHRIIALARAPQGAVNDVVRLRAMLPRQAVEAFEHRRRRLVGTWAAEQLQELKETYLDKLVQPIPVAEDPLQAIARRVTGDVSGDLDAYLDVIRSCYDERPLPSPPHLMFKSIEVSDLPRYGRMFPEMKFIHIMRHPYSNYSSLKRTDMVQKQKPFWYQGATFSACSWSPAGFPTRSLHCRGSPPNRRDTMWCGTRTCASPPHAS
ncbi:MAG: DUF1476 domain-containing protein [Nitrospira sp.]|nr:DUF1476 domain-containing protein [Nitrospira sp.]